jgi:hypothetical protein
MDASTINLENMTEADLRELIRSAQVALDRQVALRAKTTLKEIRRLAVRNLGALQAAPLSQSEGPAFQPGKPFRSGLA